MHRTASTRRRRYLTPPPPIDPAHSWARRGRCSRVNNSSSLGSCRLPYSQILAGLAGQEKTTHHHGGILRSTQLGDAVAGSWRLRWRRFGPACGKGTRRRLGLIHWAKKKRQDNEMRIRGSAKIAARWRGAVAGAPKSEAMASGRR